MIKIEKSFFSFCLLAVVSMSIAACGGVSDAKKQDAGNVAGGLSSSMGNTSGNLQETSGRELGEMSSTIHGLYWWANFAAQARALEAQKQMFAPGDASGFALSACPVTATASTQASTGASCTGSCNAALTSITRSCTMPDGTKESCSGTSYTFTGASVSASVDFSALTFNASANPPQISGSISLTVNFQANVTGGSLDGKTLSCSFSDSFTPSATGAAAASPALGCSNFSCKWDGKDISCQDLQSKMGMAACTKTT